MEQHQKNHHEEPPPSIDITEQYRYIRSDDNARASTVRGSSPSKEQEGLPSPPSQSPLPSSSSSTTPFFEITSHQIESFQKDGYAIFPNVFDLKSVHRLNQRLEFVLRGVYDSGVKPDKVPKLVKLPLPKDDNDDDTVVDGEVDHEVEAQRNEGDSIRGDDHDGVVEVEPKKNSMGSSPSLASLPPSKTHDKNAKKSKKRMKKNIAPLGYSGNKTNIKVMQIINIRKSDILFSQLAVSEILGYMVSKLMKWENGARLAQDQVWAKPPGAPPLAYHRDSPYFMFAPHQVATVWIALDDMVDDLGPLTYVRSSHLWNDGRVGSSKNFFQSNGGKALLYSAAERSGVDKNDLEFVSMSGLCAGGLSIHDGRTWHGSSENKTNFPRRGIGLHYVPVDVRWTEDAMKSTLWKRYVEDVMAAGGDVESIEVDECDFPIVYSNR